MQFSKSELEYINALLDDDQEMLQLRIAVRARLGVDYCALLEAHTHVEKIKIKLKEVYYALI